MLIYTKPLFVVCPTGKSPRSLTVRILGFHPRDPGSIPGEEAIATFFCFFLAAYFFGLGVSQIRNEHFCQFFGFLNFFELFFSFLSISRDSSVAQRVHARYFWLG